MSDEQKNKDVEDKDMEQTEAPIDPSSNEEKSVFTSGLLASLFDRAAKVSAKAKRENPPLDSDEIEKAVLNNMNRPQGVAAPHKLRLAFLGGGSFGTAMSNLAARNGCDSTLWVRNKRTVKSLQKTRINKNICQAIP